MYTIDFNTCTPRDIIRRSIVCHPSLLRDRMREVTEVHAKAANVMSHHRDRTTAERLKNACAYVAALIDSDLPDDEKADRITLLGMDFWISTLNVAAKLQCIPFATVSDVVTRCETARNAQ